MSSMILSSKSLRYSFSAGILLMLALFSMSCHKDEQLPGLDMPYVMDFTIPPGIGFQQTYHIRVENIFTRYENTLTLGNKRDSDIVRIVAAEANLTGEFGDADFSFVEEATIDVFSMDNTTVQREIAYRYPTPLEPGNNLGLIPSASDVKDIMKAPRYGVDIALRMRKTTTTETDVRMTLLLKALYER